VTVTDDMALRKHHVPWKAAGRASETHSSADDVVRDTGWVFNNETGQRLTLAEFVASGDTEVVSYLEAFGLRGDHTLGQTLVEIGSGIGRMTAGFSRTFGTVVACDLDAAFLERCRETVAQFGYPQHLRTSHVADGRTLSLDDRLADLTFSYITLQHCASDDALALSVEACRVTRVGGHVALNYRTWTAADIALWPLGMLMRGVWRIPRVGPWLARRRFATRLGWQANRLSPDTVLGHLTTAGVRLTDVRVVTNPRRRSVDAPGAVHTTFDGVHRSHWWLVARVEG
jgi:SAM-dependent methyltransferase